MFAAQEESVEVALCYSLMVLHNRAKISVFRLLCECVFFRAEKFLCLRNPLGGAMLGLAARLGGGPAVARRCEPAAARFGGPTTHKNIQNYINNQTRLGRIDCTENLYESTSLIDH